jgi:hypothetical protein
MTHSTSRSVTPSRTILALIFAVAACSPEQSEVQSLAGSADGETSSTGALERPLSLTPVAQRSPAAARAARPSDIAADSVVIETISVGEGGGIGSAEVREEDQLFHSRNPLSVSSRPQGSSSIDHRTLVKLANRALVRERIARHDSSAGRATLLGASLQVTMASQPTPIVGFQIAAHELSYYWDVRDVTWKCRERPPTALGFPGCTQWGLRWAGITYSVEPTDVVPAVPFGNNSDRRHLIFDVSRDAERMRDGGQHNGWMLLSTPAANGPATNVSIVGSGIDAPKLLLQICAPKPERFDGRDNDCDGQVDEGMDLDSDGYHDDDCDDSRSNVYPGAPEVLDGLDNDCDGQVDEDPPTGFVISATEFKVYAQTCEPSRLPIEATVTFGYPLSDARARRVSVPVRPGPDLVGCRGMGQVDYDPTLDDKNFLRSLGAGAKEMHVYVKQRGSNQSVELANSPSLICMIDACQRVTMSLANSDFERVQADGVAPVGWRNGLVCFSEGDCQEPVFATSTLRATSGTRSLRAEPGSTSIANDTPLTVAGGRSYEVVWRVFGEWNLGAAVNPFVSFNSDGHSSNTWSSLPAGWIENPVSGHDGWVRRRTVFSAPIGATQMQFSLFPSHSEPVFTDEIRLFELR